MGSRLVGSFAQQLDATYRYNASEGTSSFHSRAERRP